MSKGIIYIMTTAVPGLIKIGNLDFYITDPDDYKKAEGRIRVFGIPEKACEFMRAHGVTVEEYPGTTDAPVMIGNPGPEALEREMKKLEEFCKDGGKVFYMQYAPFAEAPSLFEKIPTTKRIVGASYTDHLYHKEAVATDHPLFADMPHGLFDADWYDRVFPHEILRSDSSEINSICSG